MQASERVDRGGPPRRWPFFPLHVSLVSWEGGGGVNVCRVASHPWLLPVNLYRLDLDLEMLFGGHEVICRVLSATALAEAGKRTRRAKKYGFGKRF